MKAFFTSFPLQKHSGRRAQAIVEFAIVLPILLVVLVGIFEAGRMVFIYAAVNNASREAVRYASAVGRNNANTADKYRDCKGIRDTARTSAFFMNIPDSDIVIDYDHGPSTGAFHTCAGNIDTSGFKINEGTNNDRVNVSVSMTYHPMLKLIPFSTKAFTSKSSRTILGILELSYP